MSETPQDIFAPSETKPASKLKKIFKIIGVILLVPIIFFAQLYYKGYRATPEVKQHIDDFLNDIAHNELDRAYKLTSADFQNDISAEKFKEFVSGSSAQFFGYKEQMQKSFSINFQTGSPIAYLYSGEITYDNGDTGDFTVTLVKENDVWKIFYITINISPERLEKFKKK